MAQNRRPTEDLRVRRTRKALMQALIELTIEQGFAAITVQDIAERAMVNRATFYRHYLDKYDLLEQYMNEVYELTVEQEAVAPHQTHNPGSGKAPVGMVRMFAHVGQHADFYRSMLGAKGDLAFVRRVQHYSEKRLRSILSGSDTQATAERPPLDLCISYLSQAGVGALEWWLKDGQGYTPEQVAAWLNQLNLAVLQQTPADWAAEP